MFGLGPLELLLILILVLFFYGGKKLPSIGEGLGRCITEFRKSIRSQPAPEPGKESTSSPDVTRTVGSLPPGTGRQGEERAEK